MSIPRLSLKNYLNDDVVKKNDFINELWQGMREYGFIILKDHNITQEQIDDAYRYAKEFFYLPFEVKNKYFMNNGGQRGYTPPKVEHAKDHKFPDLKEFWHIGRDFPKGSELEKTYPLNVWPDEVPEFNKTFLTLYNKMETAASYLLSAIGVKLKVEDDFFDKVIHNGNSILRIIYYPPIKGEDTKNSMRAAPHEDINLITLLVGATDSGLQLLDRNNKWLDIESKPGEIVVDIGDMMSRLCNDVLPSTTHRVINPNNDSSERFSMPFFVHPHSDVVLSCLESCIGDGVKYKDISAGDFLKQRLEEIGLKY